MQTENQRITTWTAVKRTPATLAGWMLIGAMILPAVSFLSGPRSMLDFMSGAIGGCVVAIFLRAAVVALTSKNSD
jgi:hypothetical protein